MNHQIRWTTTKIGQRLRSLEPLVYRARLPLPPFRLMSPADPHDPALVGPELDDSLWPLIPPDSHWGSPATEFVLRTHFQAPADWTDAATVAEATGSEAPFALAMGAAAPIALYLPLGEADFSHPEALAYIDGVPLAACDRHHRELQLPARLLTGRSHLLALQGWTGLGGMTDAGQQGRLLMRPCEIVRIDRPIRDFIATARVALGVAELLRDDAPAKGRLLNALDEAFALLDTHEPFSARFYAGLDSAHAVLREGIEAAGAPLDVDIVATGHAHIDNAWLWTLDQARRKAARTFHNVLSLMEEFPSFHFTQSQPQLYDYVRRDHPELFQTIRRRVAEKQWEPIGGMWVEADCNVTGPESLVRQLLLGRAFFREQFGPGAESPVLWLPDVFGFAWNLPQLLKQAGLDYFFTSKISWNQYNRFPYDSFWWQGLDGTRVLTAFGTSPAS